MAPENKYRVLRGLKVFGLFAWAILAIATVCVVWNSKAGAAASVLAGVLLIVNAVAIFLIARSLKTSDIEDPHFENPIDLTRKK